MTLEGLTEGKDYTVDYDIGEYTSSVTIKGIGGYKGQKILRATKDTEMIVQEDGIQYNLLNNGEAEVYDFIESGTEANIKSTIKDHNVTKINMSAFRNCKDLKVVRIPQSVLDIDQDTFKDCKTATIIKN